MGLRLCGSANLLSLDALIYFFQVDQAIILVDAVLHLALNSFETKLRRIGKIILFFIERTGNTEFLGDFVWLRGHLDPNVGLMNGVAIDVNLHFRLEEIAIGLITHRLSLNSIFMLDLLYLQDLIQAFKSNLLRFAQFNLLPDQFDYFLLDEVFLEVLLLQLLHEQIAVLHLYVHFLHLLSNHCCLLSYLLVLVEQLVGLRLEVIQLIAQFPDLVFCVLLRYGFVQLLDDLPGLLPHLLNLVLDQ